MRVLVLKKSANPGASPLMHHAEHGFYNGFVNKDGSHSGHIGSHEAYAKQQGHASVSSYLKATGAVRLGISGHHDSPSKQAYASFHGDNEPTPAQHVAVSKILGAMKSDGFRTHVEAHGDNGFYKQGTHRLEKSFKLFKAGAGEETPEEKMRSGYFAAAKEHHAAKYGMKGEGIINTKDWLHVPVTHGGTTRHFLMTQVANPRVHSSKWPIHVHTLAKTSAGVPLIQRYKLDHKNNLTKLDTYRSHDDLYRMPSLHASVGMEHEAFHKLLGEHEATLSAGIAKFNKASKPRAPRKTKITKARAHEYVQKLKEARAATHATPSRLQAKAGNYKMGVVKIHGFRIKIENPKGSYRRGYDPEGNPTWKTKMGADYGYFSRRHSGEETPIGRDGDPVDVYIGPHPESQLVFVVDQVNQAGEFDEHKVVMGATNEEEARRVYLSCYSPGWTGLGAITPMHVDAFRRWMGSLKYSRANERGPVSESIKKSRSELIHAVDHAEDGIRSTVHETHLNYAVALHDTDAGMQLPEIRQFPLTPDGRARAIKHAHELVPGGVALKNLKKAVGYHGTRGDRADKIMAQGFRYRLRTGKAAFGNQGGDSISSVVPGGYVAKNPMQPMSLAHHSGPQSHAIAVVSAHPDHSVADEDHSDEHLHAWPSPPIKTNANGTRQYYHDPAHPAFQSHESFMASPAGKKLKSVFGAKADDAAKLSRRYQMNDAIEHTERLKKQRHYQTRAPLHDPSLPEVPSSMGTTSHPYHPTGDKKFGYRHRMAELMGGRKSWQKGGTMVVGEDAPHLIHGVIHIDNVGTEGRTRSGGKKHVPESHEAYWERTKPLREVLAQPHRSPQAALRAVEATPGPWKVVRNPALKKALGQDHVWGYAAASEGDTQMRKGARFADVAKKITGEEIKKARVPKSAPSHHVMVQHYDGRPQVLASYHTADEAHDRHRSESQIMRMNNKSTGMVDGKFVVFGHPEHGSDVMGTKLWVQSDKPTRVKNAQRFADTPIMKALTQSFRDPASALSAYKNSLVAASSVGRASKPSIFHKDGKFHLSHSARTTTDLLMSGHKQIDHAQLHEMAKQHRRKEFAASGELTKAVPVRIQRLAIRLLKSRRR